jgi:type I restriction enzyme, S subunit
VRLSDIIDFNPRTSLPRSHELPFVDMAALPTSGRDISELAWRSGVSSGAKFKNGDTLLARITPCLENGKGAKVANLPEPGMGQGSTEFIVMRAKRASDEDFVYYLSRHPAFRAFAIQQMVGTSGRQRVSWQSLVDFEIADLDTAQRQSVGRVLSALDDKIELNRRMNQTLEAMAQAIFRDWFVDFGPVRRKLEGATDPVAIMGGLVPDPVRAAELAGLFPGGFGEDELPVGWSASTVGDAFNLTMGQSPPGETYNDTGDGLPFFQGRTDFGFRFPERRKFCSQPTRIANPDDTLISVRAPVGDLNMAWEECCIGRGVAAARHKAGGKTYTYYAMRHLQPELEQFESEGTVFGAINKKQFEQLPIVGPDARLVDAFEVVAGALDDRLRIAVTENRTLAETRDYLLPRLMSGEVRVGELEAEVA